MKYLKLTKKDIKGNYKIDKKKALYWTKLGLLLSKLEQLLSPTDKDS